MGSLASIPVGAFTPSAIAAIQQAINQMGLFTTGNVFYVDPVNGLDTNNGQSPVASNPPNGTGPTQTLAAGYAFLRSGFNDILVLIGNGASTGSARLTAGFTWSKNAAHLVGICAPSAVSQRARIANTTTGAAFANFFTVSGNGCRFQNVSWFQGFAAGVAAEICLTVSGQRNAFINCDIEGMGDATGAASATSRNILLSAGENIFQHCNIGLDTVARTGANSSVEVSGNAARNIFENCTFLFDSGDGATLGLLTAGAAALDRFILFNNCLFMNATQSGATAMATLCTLAATSGGWAVFHGCGLVGVTKIGGANATNDGQIAQTMPVASVSGGLSTQPT